MLRSEINSALRSAELFLRETGFCLPRWASWPPARWAREAGPAAEIRACRLGWDVTDFGRGTFSTFGLTLFTIRNGSPSGGVQKPYAEKIMIAADGQHNPLHFHFNKIEDIINRAGGTLCLEVHASGEEGAVLDTMLDVTVDGIKRSVRSGTVLELARGESITIEPGVYHRFWSRPGSGRVLLGEVSSVNDDENDNHFAEALSRFSRVEEDEPALYLLCNEYPDVASTEAP